MSGGWEDQDAPPARGRGASGGQVATNYHTPVGQGELEQWDQTWEQSEVKEPGGFGRQHPDGTYIAQLEIARIERTRKDGTPMLTLGFAIVAGPDSGEIMHRRVISNSDNVRYIRQDLHNMGIDPPLLSQADEYIQSALGIYVEIVLRTKKDKNGTPRQNLYLNRAIDPDEVGGAVASASAPTDDVPF